MDVRTARQSIRDRGGAQEAGIASESLARRTDEGQGQLGSCDQHGEGGTVVGGPTGRHSTQTKSLCFSLSQLITADFLPIQFCIGFKFSD